MRFLTYKPKAMENVRAEQVTIENISEVAASFPGSARVFKDGEQAFVLKIATLDGVIEAVPSQWVVRRGNGVEVMEDSAFNAMYERARTTREN